MRQPKHKTDTQPISKAGHTTMAKKASTPKTATSLPAESFSAAQVAEIRQIVSDYLTNDEFDITLPEDAVVDAVKTALTDKAVLTKLAESVK
jgi:hypothetical protein